MLFQPEPEIRRSRFPGYASVAVHFAIFVLLVWKPLPHFIKAQSVLHGTGGSNHGKVFISWGGAVRTVKPADVEEDSRAKLPRPRRSRKPVEVPAPAMASALTPTSNGPAGSQLGTLSYGYADGHDVRPAYPVFYPDPTVARAVCPPDLRGDVIVEVTIDKQGNIIGTRLLTGLRREVDERVIAVVQNWRYHPATRDGIPIASQQDVHFHFPV